MSDDDLEQAAHEQGQRDAGVERAYRQDARRDARKKALANALDDPLKARYVVLICFVVIVAILLVVSFIYP